MAVEPAAMHNRALHATLAAFVTEAAEQLSEDVAGGAEIPYELIEQGRASAPLYCYRPLSDRFIAERASMLSRLPSYPSAVRGMAGLPKLESYLQLRSALRDRHAGPEEALSAFLCALWAESTDFTFEESRFETAYAELEHAAYEGTSLTRVVTPIEGLVLESDRVELGGGVSLVRAAALSELPADLRGDAYRTLAVVESDSPDQQGPSLEYAGRRLKRLQTALRLWDGAEPAVGPVAWAKTGDAAWVLVALPGGMRRAVQDYKLSPEEEDPLRAFCALVARRSPRSGELAWALRRFELGCERGNVVEALTDWLMAARALLGNHGSRSDELVCERLAAICAVPEQHEAVSARLREAVALERRVISGVVRPDDHIEALVAELGDQLRAVLRDVLCGHLQPELRHVADSLGARQPISL
ncbi:MAG: hypothetical protein M3P40_04450 [Actinomycetota bacterium]|nr:hypothetical protein [Actinomycetota bacterium]